jgi:alkaline phosphatase
LEYGRGDRVPALLKQDNERPGAKSSCKNNSLLKVRGSMRRLPILILLLLVLAASAFGAPKNIIFMIGDGMGIAHVSAARIVTGGLGSKLAMDSMPISGFVTTYSANSSVTDSAAAATALATGVKTNNGVIGQDPKGQRLKSILEAAREIGKSTGLVTTTAITEATPAGFGAHVKSRGEQVEIAEQLLAGRIDVLLGGGRAYFMPKSKEGSWRTDEQDLFAKASTLGYKLAGTVDELSAAKGPKVIGLFAPGNLTTQSPEPPLTALTTKATASLSQNKKGFFLMVEGGQIDSYAHSNDFDGMIRQLTEFDRSVAAAIDFARRDGNTLVIVTADHETGGLTLLQDGTDKIKPAWSSGGHTGVVAPLYAFGPGSEKFAGLKDNTEVAKTLAKLWGVTIGLQGSAGKPTSSNVAVAAAPL